MKKTDLIRFRCTHDDRELIEILSKRDGKTISDFLLTLIHDEADRRIENQKTIYYLPTDDNWLTVFTNCSPCCITRSEAEYLLREWRNFDDNRNFDELWREASDEEISNYGISE